MLGGPDAVHSAHWQGRIEAQSSPVEARQAASDSATTQPLQAMEQSFLPSNMCSQIASVHHHVYCVKCSEVGAISQDMAPEHVTKYKDQASHVTHQQHLQMGLRKGMVILVYYVVESTRYQVVLLAQESVLGKGGKTENRLWKRVTPHVTEFAWLPPAIAESFCGKALYRDNDRVYFPFNQPHLGLGTKDFDGPMVIEDIFYLGDTRSADDLAVFTGMPPERLYLGCGLRVVEPFSPIATGERMKLFLAAHLMNTLYVWFPAVGVHPLSRPSARATRGGCNKILFIEIRPCSTHWKCKTELPPET